MAEESEASVLTCKKSRVVFLGALRVTTVTSICLILTLRPSLGPSPKAGSTTPQPRALHAAAADRLPHFQTDVLPRILSALMAVPGLGGLPILHLVSHPSR